jgi:hypothetical protein
LKTNITVAIVLVVLVVLVGAIWYNAAVNCGQKPIVGTVIAKNICQHWNYSHDQVAVQVKTGGGYSLYTINVKFAHYGALQVGHTYRFIFDQGFFADQKPIQIEEITPVPQVPMPRNVNSLA